MAVTATPEFEVVDRRRIELIEPGLPSAPIHHRGGTHQLHGSGELLDDDSLAALVAEVRTSVARMTVAALDELVDSISGPITAVAIRGWPSNFPEDIALKRRPPYESRADSVMYCQVLAEVARERGWVVHFYDAKNVEAEAAALLGARANDVLNGPRKALGPPWSRDHRTALAATIVLADPATSVVSPPTAANRCSTVAINGVALSWHTAPGATMTSTECTTRVGVSFAPLSSTRRPLDDTPGRSGPWALQSTQP